MNGSTQNALGVEVTTRCNISCHHCFARAGNAQASSLPLKVVKDIILEGQNEDFHILSVTGGEPLLWEGLPEALNHALEAGYEEIFLNTNGTLLTAAAAGTLAAYKGLSISVSLEGTEESHNRLRGEGTRERTLRGVENALNAGVGLCIFTVALKSLLPRLPQFAFDLYEHFPGVQRLTLIRLVPPSGRDFTLEEEALDPDDFLRLTRTVALLNLYGLRTDILYDPLMNAASYLLGTPHIPPSMEPRRPGQLIVMADRSVRLFHSSGISLGAYEPGALSRILASGAYRKATAPDTSTCPGCDYFALCREHGLSRPAPWCTAGGHDDPYCKKVLEGARRDSGNSYPRHASS